MSATLLKDGISHTSRPKSFLRVPLKLFLFGLTMIFYFLSMSVLKFVCLFVSLDKAKHWPNVWTQTCARWCLFFMGVQVHKQGALKPGASLLVGNHLSYIDAIVLAAMTPCHFVTSIEIKNTPVLGQVCQLANCLFVERRSRKYLSNEVADISLALKQGRSVVIFPEGTSTNGDQVLRFKRPLFQAALDARVPVQTFCLNYSGFEDRDDVCWYGEMGFFSHLKRFFALDSLEVEVVMGAERVAGTSAEDLSLGSRQEVLKSFRSLSQG